MEGYMFGALLDLLFAFYCDYIPRTFSYLNRQIYNQWLHRTMKVGMGLNLHLPVIFKGKEYIVIGKNFYSGSGLRMEAWDFYAGQKFMPKIVIGNNVCVGENCHIGAINSVLVKDNVLMGRNVYITDHFHGNMEECEINMPPKDRKLHSKGNIIIEENVWIGDNVVIMPNVKIGRGTVIGANAVVTHSIPACAVIGGVPAKILYMIG